MPAGVIIPDWPAPSRVRAAVTTRTTCGRSLPPFDRCNLGLRSGDNVEAASHNRVELERLLHLPSAPRWLHQVHGVTVARHQSVDSAATETQADASITREPGVVIAILTADCLPLLVCAADGSEIAAVHAGWRGLAAGVIERTIDSFQTPANALIVWLGPAIGAHSYEVGLDVHTAFMAQDLRNASAFTPTRSGHWLCDLYALARRRLEALGIRQIFGGGFDTFADERFYSYRREPVTGRFASLIWLVD